MNSATYQQDGTTVRPLARMSSRAWRDQGRGEPPAAHRWIDHGVGHDDAVAVDDVVRHPDHLAVDGQLVAGFGVVAGHLGAHGPIPTRSARRDARPPAATAAGRAAGAARLGTRRRRPRGTIPARSPSARWRGGRAARRPRRPVGAPARRRTGPNAATRKLVAAPTTGAPSTVNIARSSGWVRTSSARIEVSAACRPVRKASITWSSRRSMPVVETMIDVKKRWHSRASTASTIWLRCSKRR